MARFHGAATLFGLAALFVVSIAASSSPSSGSEPTGGISGVVTDATGAVLRDCLVSLESPLSPARQQESGEAGGYSFFGLPPGVYRVTFELSGFRTAVADGVTVGAGSHVDLDVTLELESLSGAVEVSAQPDAVDRRKTGASRLLDRSQLQQVPNGRSVWAALEQTTGLITDRFDVGGSESGQQSLFSAAGTSYAQNQFSVNGVNATDPVALGSSSTYYAFDGFEEIQVSTSGHPAEVQTPGVFLNIVLKGGTERLAGGAAFYFENDVLESDNLDSDLRARGVSETNQLRSYRDYSLELGGPMVPKRAFFYSNFSRQSLEPFVVGFFLGNGERGTDRTDLTTFVARGRVELARNGQVGFLYFRNEKLRPNREASRLRPTPETTLYQDSTTDIFQASYRRMLGEEALLDARLSRLDLTFPLGERPDLPADTFSRIELANGVRSGGPGSDELFVRDRTQANVSLFSFVDGWLGGSHDWKAGLDLSENPASTTYDLNGAILYRDLYGVPLQVELYSEPLETETRTASLGLFVQDTYVRGPWVANLGIRFDRWTAGYPSQSRSPGPWEDFFRSRGLPESTEGDSRVVDFRGIAPRLGLTYAMTSDGKTLLRASYSRYYHQIGTDVAAFRNGNARASALFTFVDENGNRLLDRGEIDFEAPLAVSLPAVNEIDPGIEQPRTDEFLLGLERELPFGIVVTGSLVYRKDHELFDDVNVGVPPGEFEEDVALDPGRDLVPGTKDDALVPVFNQSRESLGRDRRELTNPAGLESRYRGILLEARRRYRDGWQLMASLALSEAEGFLPAPGWESLEGAFAATPLFDNPNRSTNAKGRTFWDRPRVFRISGSYDWKWGLLFSGSYRYQTGQPRYRSILVDRTASGVLLNQGVVEILAEPEGAIVQPAIHLLDLRAAKSFGLGDYGEIDVVFDVFNALNANTPTEIASRAGAFGAILTILPPRVARVGVRYRFGSGR